MTIPVDLRVRQALSFPGLSTPDGVSVVDPYVSIRALGSVLAEILAHFSDEEAQAVVDAVLVCRREWLEMPRLGLDQIEPQGAA